MIIDLGSVLRAPRHFEFTLEPDWWQPVVEYDQILGLSSDLTVRIDISKVGNRFEIKGRVSGGLKIRCGRCLESYDTDLDTEFSLFLTQRQSVSDQIELELLEEDMSIDFIEDDKIDLDEIVRAQVYLSLPMKCLCSENCRGLCPVCGINLNKEQCECRKETGHPGFSKLKNFVVS